MAINAPGFRPAAAPLTTTAHQRQFQRNSAPNKPGAPAPPKKPVEVVTPYARTADRWLKESTMFQVGEAMSSVVPEVVQHVGIYLEHERDKKAKELQYQLYSMDDKEAGAFYEEQERLLGPNHKRALKEQYALRMGYSAATKVFADIKSGNIDLTQQDVGDVLGEVIDPFLQEHDDPTIRQTIQEQIGEVLPKLRQEQQNALAARQQEQAVEGFYGTALSAMQSGIAEDLAPEAIAERVRGLYGRFGPGTDLNLSHSRMDEVVVEAAAWAADQGHEDIVDALLVQERKGTDGKTIPPIANKAKYRKQIDSIKQTAEARKAKRLADVNQGFLTELQIRAAMGENVEEDIDANPWIKDVWTPTQVARIKTTSRKAQIKMAEGVQKERVDSELRARVNQEVETWAAAAAADPAAIWDIGDLEVISNTDPSKMKSMEADEIREQIAKVNLGEAASPGFDPRENPGATKNAVSWLAQSGYQWDELNERLETATTLVSAKAFAEGKAPDATKEAMAWYREAKAQGALSALGIEKEAKTFYEATLALEQGQFKGDTDAALLQIARMKENPIDLTNTSALSDRSELLKGAVQTVTKAARSGGVLGFGKQDIINPGLIRRDIKTSARSLMEMGFEPKQAMKIATESLKDNYMSINGFAFTKGNRNIPPNIEEISEFVVGGYMNSGLAEDLGIDDASDLALVPDTVGGQSVWQLQSKSLGAVPNSGTKRTWKLANGETMEMPAGRFTSAQLRVLYSSMQQEAIQEIEDSHERPSNPEVPNSEPQPQQGLTEEELNAEPPQSSPEVDTRQPSQQGDVWPLAIKGRISSGYGMRMHPIDKVKRMHTGVDIAAKQGTPIHSIAGGVVKSAGKRGGYGNMVEIEHPDGHVTRYAHAHELKVKPGQRVMRGDTIATVGSTGKSTGPHLHFEVRDPDGKPVDPMKQMANVGGGAVNKPDQQASANVPRLLYAYETPALKSARDLFKEKGDPLWKAFDQELNRRGET